jgi:hypothetical protein
MCSASRNNKLLGSIIERKQEEFKWVNWFKIAIFWLRARRDSVLKRSVHVVREHLKLNRTAAIGQKMAILNQF